MKLSPFVLRIEWALKLKGIEYEYMVEDLRNKSPQLLQYNPVHKAVPIIVHHGKPVAESTVILEYIDDEWKDRGPSILPSDPCQRATTRFWVKFCEEKCLQGNKFFGSETLVVVDIVAGLIPFWVGIIEEINGVKIVDEEHLPLLSAWMRDILDLELVKESMPPLDEVKAHMTAIRENILASLPSAQK